MKPYAVEVSFTMIVMAEDGDSAHEVAEDWADEEWAHGSISFNALGTVRNAGDLARFSGWDADAVPYGGDGETSLRTILADLPPVVERDPRTIDMFSEQAS